jgi:hypothetical protein
MAEKDSLTRKALSVDVLVLDGGTQSRAEISEFTVEEYTEVLANTGDRWPFPPLDVFHDGNQYLVASGFHRTIAARRHGRASVPCIIHQGTAWDALLFGMASNHEHGLRPTQADKRHAVELLLDSGKKLTQQQIADAVGVTTRTVQRIVAERKDQNPTLSGSDRKTGNSGDPFGEDTEDPFGEESGTDRATPKAEGQEDHQQELSPRPPRSGKDAPGGSSERTPAEEFRLQKAKTVKTCEALMRAFDDLNRLRKSQEHKLVIEECKTLLSLTQKW